MDWKKVINSPWLAIAGLVSLVWGIPGMREDATGWREMYGVMNPGWFYAAAGVGAALSGIWLAVLINHYRATIRTYWKEIAGIAAGVLVLGALVSGIGYMIYLIVTREPPPKPVWLHPGMAVAEQEKAKAECRIAAYEALGSGSGKLGDPVPGNRADYIANCLTAKGFRLERVND